MVLHVQHSQPSGLFSVIMVGTALRVSPRPQLWLTQESHELQLTTLEHRLQSDHTDAHEISGFGQVWHDSVASRPAYMRRLPEVDRPLGDISAAKPQ